MQKSGKHRIFQFLTTSNNPLIYNPLQRFGCHQSVKDKNSESTESAKFVLSTSFSPLESTEQAVFVLSTPFSPFESTKPGVFVLSKPKVQMCKMRQKQLSLSPNYKANDYEQNKDSDIGL